MIDAVFLIYGRIFSGKRKQCRIFQGFAVCTWTVFVKSFLFGPEPAVMAAKHKIYLLF
jgi:hypothetical protein